MSFETLTTKRKKNEEKKQEIQRVKRENGK
jgi:hypothetical protein